MMSYKTILKAGAPFLLIGSLAACDDPPDMAPPEAMQPTPPTAATFQSRISTAFAAIFNRATTQDPVEPTAGDVPPLAPASDPIDN